MSRSATEHRTDDINYMAPDSGCTFASKMLGEPSQCLKNCPFPEGCIYDTVEGEDYRLGHTKRLRNVLAREAAG